MTLHMCIVTGEGWREVAQCAIDALPELDPRVVREILDASTYTVRLWFLLNLLYVLNIDITTEDPYFMYLLEHGYDSIQPVIYTVGDVYRYMYELHRRMEEHRDMVGALRIIHDGNADHRGSAAGARVNRNE